MWVCRLEDTGFGVGLRLLEILSFREKGSKRDIRLLDVLKFIHTSLWKYLFGHHARDLEQSNTVHTVPPDALTIMATQMLLCRTFCGQERCDNATEGDTSLGVCDAG